MGTGTSPAELLVPRFGGIKAKWSRKGTKDLERPPWLRFRSPVCQGGIIAHPELLIGRAPKTSTNCNVAAGRVIAAQFQPLQTAPQVGAAPSLSHSGPRSLPACKR